ncbi:hypothetical protein [Tannerella forsythia]|nr:hypothetical protein [Tannerella forsythia]
MKMKTRHDYPILLLALIAGLMGFTTGAPQRMATFPAIGSAVDKRK